MEKIITSSNNPFVKQLLALKSSKDKKEKNLFFIEGQDLVDMAYQSHQLDMVITSRKKVDYDVKDIVYCPDFILQKLSFNKSVPDLIGIAHYEDNKEIFGSKLVYLDGVQDPGNVGTIIRTALAFSYDTVILSPDCASKYNEKVIQSSKGAIFSIPVVDNVSLIELKEKNYQIIATALKNAHPVEEFFPTKKFVLVLGNEGQGVKQANLDLADSIVKIDMDHIDSLNVAVAGGIILNQFKKFVQ